jgi:ABC-type phosphonate transport system ATPase subunit
VLALTAVTATRRRGDCDTPLRRVAFSLGVGLVGNSAALKNQHGTTTVDAATCELRVSGANDDIGIRRAPGPERHILNQPDPRPTSVFERSDGALRPHRGRDEVRRYSGDMKRRHDIAMLLAGAPRIVFLHEQATGLAPRSPHHDVLVRAHVVSLAVP